MTSTDATAERPREYRPEWMLWVAKVVTEVTAPFVLASALLIVVALDTATSGTSAIVWGLIAAVFAAGVSFAFILRGARAGSWSTHHVNERERRPFVLGIALGSLLFGVLVLAAWNVVDGCDGPHDESNLRRRQPADRYHL